MEQVMKNLDPEARETYETIDRARTLLQDLRDKKIGFYKGKLWKWERACAVCKRFINPETQEHDESYAPKGEPDKDYVVSHGYCPSCFEKQMHAIREFAESNK